MRLMKSVGHEVGGGIQNLCKILGGGMHFMTKILGGGIQIFIGRKSKSPGPPPVVNTEPSLSTIDHAITEAGALGLR